jgi:hypothetical protein
MKLIDKDQSVSESLAKLLKHFSIDAHKPLQEIVRITQPFWLQKKREQNTQDKTLLDTKLRALFTNMGMVNAIYPVHKNYDYILLLGSDEPDMKARIAFLNEQIKKGISASRFIVLTSDRPLYDYEKSQTNAGTEQQMIQELIAQLNPEHWHQLEYCQANGKTNADGFHQRATTEDTIKTWLATKPSPGNCLVISQQPYIGRQNAVLKMYLHNGWKFETVGPQLDAQFTLEDMLDTLARWVYQEYQNLR